MLVLVLRDSVVVIIKGPCDEVIFLYVWFFNILTILFQIPIMFNAVGGILVGLVTSYAGGVRKVIMTGFH